MGKALSGGSGWVLLTWSDRLGRLHNQWAADHAHALAEGVPIFALDMYEHAYALDFGPKAAAYVDAVMRNLHWGRISARYSRIAARAIPPAPVHGIAGITVGELRSKLAQHIDLVLLDVCLAEDLPRRPDMLPGARFVLAEDFDHWAPELPRDRPVIVSCMYGFQVSEDAATELRRRGVDAYKLAGGLSAWRAMDGRTAPLNAGVYEGGLP
jgi:Fe-Mn family superoxide dismutase